MTTPAGGRELAGPAACLQELGSLASWTLFSSADLFRLSGTLLPLERETRVKRELPLASTLYHWSATGSCELTACPRQPSRQPTRLGDTVRLVQGGAIFKARKKGILESLTDVQ